MDLWCSRSRVTLRLLYFIILQCLWAWHQQESWGKELSGQWIPGTWVQLPVSASMTKAPSLKSVVRVSSPSSLGAEWCVSNGANLDSFV